MARKKKKRARKASTTPKKATPEGRRRRQVARAKREAGGWDRADRVRSGRVLRADSERRTAKKVATGSKPAKRPKKPRTRPPYNLAQIKVRAHIRDVGEYSRKYNPAHLPMREGDGRWIPTTAEEMAELREGAKTRTRRITVQPHERIMRESTRNFDRTHLPIRTSAGRFTSAAKQQIGLFGIKL